MDTFRSFSFPICATCFVAVPFLIFPQRLAQAEDLKRFEYRSVAMGSNLDIILYAPNGELAETAIEVSLETLERESQAINNYDSQSAVSKLNQLSPNTPLRVEPTLGELLQESHRWHRISLGTFDSTASPVFKVWKEARKRKEKPTDTELRETTQYARWSDIELSVDEKEKNYTLVHRSKKLSIDLGGLAVGFLIDRMMDALKEQGIRSAMIDAGGDIIVSEAPPNREGWLIDVAGLSKEDPVLKRLALVNASVTTSGDLNQFAIIDNVRYSHIIDPRTNHPVTTRSSVTVVARKGIDADAGATVLTVLKEEEVEKIWEDLPLLDAYVQTLDENGALKFRHWSRKGKAQ